MLKESPEKPPLRRLPVLLRRSWYGLNQAFRRRIAHTQCTPDQFTVLRNLHEHHPAGLTQAELTRAMSSDANTIASLLGRMERLGLIDRHRDPKDRRVRRVILKPLGEKRFCDMNQIASDLQAHILSVLPARQRSRFLEQLEQLADACRVTAES